MYRDLKLTHTKQICTKQEILIKHQGNTSSPFLLIEQILHLCKFNRFTYFGPPPIWTGPSNNLQQQATSIFTLRRIRNNVDTHGLDPISASLTLQGTITSC